MHAHAAHRVDSLCLWQLTPVRIRRRRRQAWTWSAAPGHASYARHALGGGRFHAAFDEGARLTLDAAVAEALRDRSAPADKPARSRDTAGTPARLTRRETQIAGLAARGLSNNDIAAALVISQRTVQAHIDHILGKPGFNSRIAARVADHPTARG
jgi:DNA-binding NarL/FixJ family response regulator